MPHRRYLRVVMSVVIAVGSMMAIAPSTYAAPPPPNNNEIVHTATDQCGNRAIMRAGRYDPSQGSGWGYLKMKGKHNLHNKTVLDGVFTDRTCGRQQGTSREYHKMAQLWGQWWIFPYLKDEREVISVVNYRHDPQAGGQKGMITTYCNQGGAWQCPDWVNEEPRFPPGAQTQDDSDVVTFSDDALPVGTHMSREEITNRTG